MRTTTVAEPGWQVGLVWTGFPIVGAGLLWGVRAAAGWLLSLPWIPFRGPLTLIDSIPEPWGTLVALAVGAAVGLFFAAWAAHERLTVELSDEAVTLTSRGKSHTFDRTEVSAVFLDHKKLVVLGRSSEELARESHDLPADAVADAFQRHGYPWLDADPHRDDFRRWVEDMPGLPPAANALLKARAKALKKRDDEDVRELRTELARLGVVVRDDRKRQFWRLTGQSGD